MLNDLFVPSDKISSLGITLHLMKKAAADIDVSDAEERYAFYEKVCKFRRKIAKPTLE